MRKTTHSLQIAAMIVLIIVAFFGNTLFFSYLHTDTLRNAIAWETDMVSAVLAGKIATDIPIEQILSGEMEDGSLQSLFPTEELSLTHMGIVGPDGQVYYRSTGEDTFPYLFDAAADGPLLDDAADSSLLDSAAASGSAAVWTGTNSPFLLTQNCHVIRPLFDGRLFLIISSGASYEAIQRRQLTLLSGTDFFLLCLMVILIANLITQYRREILRYATTDELTGLSNRKSFNAVFAEYMEQQRREASSLFLLDIDFFKQINDHYGHAAGDHALRFLAERIQALVRARGGFAGRWGGDEFIGVLYLSGEEALSALRGLCAEIEAAELDEGFHMTISAGITPIQRPEALAKLSERADLALYETKERGRNGATLHRLTDAAPDQSLEEVRSAIEDAVVHGEGMKLKLFRQTAATPLPSAPGTGCFRDRLRDCLRSRFIESAILGVRWMAPFVAGGGILIGLAFLFDAASVDISTLSLDVRSHLGSITPIAAVLNRVGSTTFGFMLPVFAGFMAYGIAGEEAFMAGFVGGYMTIDSNSGFIGAIAAGFAAGIITGELHKWTMRFPRFFRKAAPIIVYPAFNLILMQAVSALVITPAAAAAGRGFTVLLDMAAAQNSVSAGMLSGAMMAVDMGGIVNKVAYQYGVNGIPLGHTGLMASVMIGGMTPPVGIFLSMLLFRRKYSEHEWERGSGTLFMGLSFITEGALPYVFTDICRVIPSCIVGSAVAGGLSSLFGCTLPAPHGGIFVLPVMGHPIRFLIALAAGSLVTAVLLGVLKEDVGHCAETPNGSG